MKQSAEIFTAKRTKNIQNVLMLCALAHLQLKEEEKAVKMSHDSIMKDIKNFEAWYTYGAILISVKRYEDASKAFVQANKLPYIGVILSNLTTVISHLFFSTLFTLILTNSYLTLGLY